MLENAARRRRRSRARNRRLVTPSSLTITNSPGSTSRSYFACSRSNAQVSEANTNVSGAPFTPAIRPIESGRKPCGSRAAKIRLRVIITIENAPSTCASESAMQSTSIDCRECAISCTMISVSDVV